MEQGIEAAILSLRHSSNLLLQAPERPASIARVATFQATRAVCRHHWLFAGNRFLAIGVKRAGRKPTPEQQAFIDNVNKAGGLAFVARSVEDVQRRVLK